MSKTDKTKPFRLQVAESPSNYKEHHNHSVTECDIDLIAPGEFPGSPNHNRCYYTWTNTFMCKANGCGCRQCTGHYWRLWERRRDRHNARHWIRREGWLS